MLIDTHVHLNHDDLLHYGDGLAGVLERAAAADVGGFVVIGYDLASSERAAALAEGDARVWATVGVHPHDASSWNEETADRLRALLGRERVVAVGEIGLDFYRNLSPVAAQERAFRAQLRLAEETGRPVVIHCRDAWDETLEMLKGPVPILPVILHCFGGTRTHAERAWKRGWFLGIGGAVTFKKSDALREIVRAAPRESVLLETDAPYLSPVPLRGRYPNEPARVALVAEAVADLWGVDAAEVAAVTTENARRAFPGVRTSPETGPNSSSPFG